MSALLLLRVGVLSKVPSALTGTMLVFLIIGVLALAGNAMRADMKRLGAANKQGANSAAHDYYLDDVSYEHHPTGAQGKATWIQITDPVSDQAYWYGAARVPLLT